MFITEETSGDPATRPVHSFIFLSTPLREYNNNFIVVIEQQLEADMETLSQV